MLMENLFQILFVSQIQRSTIYSWIKENQNNNNKKREVNLKNFRAFEKKLLI